MAIRAPDEANKVAVDFAVDVAQLNAVLVNLAKQRGLLLHRTFAHEAEARDELIHVNRAIVVDIEGAEKGVSHAGLERKYLTKVSLGEPVPVVWPIWTARAHQAFESSAQVLDLQC